MVGSSDGSNDEMATGDIGLLGATAEDPGAVDERSGGSIVEGETRGVVILGAPVEDTG